MHINIAETIALQALTFIVETPQELGKFLKLTGFDANELKELAHSPEGLGGILDHLLSDENLLLSFINESGLDPNQLVSARRALPGFTPYG